MFANLELPHSLYERLQQQAKQRQLDVVALIEQLLGNQSETETKEDPLRPNVFQRIGAMAQDLGVEDLSVNHDHYIYGVDKRE